MRYLICKCKNPNTILLSLEKLGYVLNDSIYGTQRILSGYSYVILIDKTEKTYFIAPSISFILNNIVSSNIIICNDETEVLKELGIEKSNKTEKSNNPKFNKKEYVSNNILEQFDNILRDISTGSPVLEEFKSNIIPGRIVEFNIDEQKYFGFILSSQNIMYVNTKGEVKGYLNGFTMDNPYKIDRILVPTTNHYQLKDYNNMSVAWQRPIVVRKTVSEIEKELGLTPGTLVIY